MARLVIGQKHGSEQEASSRASWNTPHNNPRTGMSYGSRMALSFALTSLMTVLILVCVVAVVWGGAFSDYTRANVKEIAEITADKLAEGYERAGGTWTADSLTAIAGSSVVSKDIGMQVKDAAGKILYDDSWPAASVAASLTDDVAAGSGSSAAPAVAGSGSSTDAAPSSTASDRQSATAADSDETTPKATHSPVSTAPTDPDSAVTVPIESASGEVIGQVRLWILGSDALLTKADAAFRENTFNAMGLAAFIAVTIAIIIGFLVSRMFTNPVRRITDTARQIREGDLSARTGMRGNDEIDQLGETFDEMAASLEHDLKHERRLTSDVAHEMRTPLMAMQATVEAMQDGIYPTDYEHLETVASETRRLARLVQQTLDLSRLENHTAPLNLEPVDMVQLVRTIVNNQHQMFHNKGLHLRFTDETQGRSATIEVDPDMITQCVINLLSNAMRYTPEDGWVVAKVHGDRKHVMVTVSDTGIGIAKDDLSRIFGRFWRADASRAREAGGLGVGLAVTKQIVERHHGFIAVESELEKGTTFTIHLPREHTPDAPSSTMKH